MRTNDCLNSQIVHISKVKLTNERCARTKDPIVARIKNKPTEVSLFVVEEIFIFPT
ncbi:hypothetical protein GCM10007096_11110 [Pullulanibacillus pueri]|uniref:Uncharacterized protein n=1 Tax=Pullulanibacillus pueri TaxID=1437324 RepID=A0A8J2ZUW6_9BACL|nr:hypothetical protein GCM10007096_11110 [Pullulanibacillus pueri]